jgi:hypothetical protein
LRLPGGGGRVVASGGVGWACGVGVAGFRGAGNTAGRAALGFRRCPNLFLHAGDVVCVTSTHLGLFSIEPMLDICIHMVLCFGGLVGVVFSLVAIVEFPLSLVLFARLGLGGFRFCSVTKSLTWPTHTLFRYCVVFGAFR